MPEPITSSPDPIFDPVVDATNTLTNAGNATGGPEPRAPASAYPFLGPPARPGDLGTLGTYRVTGLLGEGGMGFVFRGEDDTLRRPVALKVMRPEVARTPLAHDRFLREGRAAAALKSDHVAFINFVGEQAGVPFLAMEFLQGQPLDRWLNGRPTPAPVAAVVRVAKDVLKGLAVAHDKGMVHRDVKPANLWVERPSGRVKVLDFGLTRGTDPGDQITTDGAMAGTPAYMAPEQAQGKPPDARADLFSVGVVLYRMLAGKSPFARGDVYATLIALATEDPPPLAEAAPGTPADVSAFVARLMAKDPAGRPADARAALAEVSVIERRLKAEMAGRPAEPVPAAGPPSTPSAVYVPALVGPRPVEPAFEFDPPDAPAASAGLPVVRRSRPGPLLWLIAVGSLAGAVVVAAGVGVVRDRNGRVVGTVDVPDGGTVEVPPGVTAKPAAPLPPGVASEGKSAADALRREDIPAVTLANAGGGDPARVPPEVVGIFGDGRFRLPDRENGFLAYSPDDKWLAVPNGPDVLLFDAHTGQLVRSFRGHTQRVYRVAFHPNGSSLATAAPGEKARLWDFKTGKTLRTLNGDSAYFVAFRPGSNELVTATGYPNEYSNDLTVWNTDTGDLVRRFQGKFGWPAFSNDGRWLAAFESGGLVHVWDATSGEERCNVNPTSDRYCLVAYGPDGDTLAVGDNAGGQIWDLKNRSKSYQLGECSLTLGFGHDGRRLMTCPQDSRGGSNAIKVWDRLSGNEERVINVGAGWDYASFTTASKSATVAYVTNNCRVVEGYDTTTGKQLSPIAGHTERVIDVAFSPDGRWVASGGHDRRVVLWDAGTGKPIREWTHTSRVWSVVFASGGKTLAAAAYDGTVRFWDTATGEVRGNYAGSVGEGFRRLATSPDGRSVAVGAADGTIRFLSARTGEETKVLKASVSTIRCVAFSADGTLVAAGAENGKAVVLERLSGKVVATVTGDGTVSYLRFGPDGGDMFVSYDDPGRVVRRWDLASGEVIDTLRGHTSHVATFALRPDFRAAVTGGAYDGTVRLWNLDPNGPRQYVFGPGLFGGTVDGVAYSPDGRHIAVSSGNGLVYILRGPDPKEDVGAWIAAKGIPPKGLKNAEWTAQVAKLSPGNQTVAVSARLRELNPEADGLVTPVVEDGQIVEATVWTKGVRGLSPLRPLLHLRALTCNGDGGSSLSDLSSLKGMKLKRLDLGQAGHPIRSLSGLEGMPLTDLGLWRTPLSDISQLQNMPLTSLSLYSTQVVDLSPLKGSPLRELSCDSTPVNNLEPLRGMTTLCYLNTSSTAISDLSPLEGLTLDTLCIQKTKVTDLSPLRKVAVKTLWLDFVPERDAAVLRDVKSLGTINDKPVAEFWKEVDAKKP